MPAALWAAGIFVGSSIPGTAHPEGGLLAHDKLLHFLVFGALATLVWLACRRPLVAIGLTALYGVTDELHQRFTPGREPSLLDLLADVAGALVWVGIAHLVTRHFWREHGHRASVRGQDAPGR